MTSLYRSQVRHSAQGFSLVELMVSLTIGLVIAIAAMSAYLGAASAGKVAEAQSRMNEDAQAALGILSQQLRMTGNNPSQANRTMESQRNPIYLPTPTFSLPTPTFTFSTVPATFTLSGFSLRGCDGKFNNINSITATLATLDTSTCVSGTSTLPPDSIAINYEADMFNTLPTTISPIRPTDCLGFGLTPIAASLPTVTTATTPTLSSSTVTYYVAENRFYVGTSSAIITPSLYCKGNGGAGTQQPLVENIEDMQFMYGTISTSTTATTATVAGYLRADEVAGLGTTPADDATRWGKVLSVRVCVLVRSESQVASTPTRYRNCAGTVVTPSDRYLRRAYATMVVLRNRRF